MYSISIPPLTNDACVPSSRRSCVFESAAFRSFKMISNERTRNLAFAHRILFLASCWIFWPGSAVAAASSASFSSLSDQWISSCPSRTVNYITHTLPQQCLRTNWTAADGSNTTKESMTVSDNAPPLSITAQVSSEAAHEHDAVVAPVATSSMPDYDGKASGMPVASIASLQSNTSDLELEADTDSPLDNANFLSFEEWKKQNLEKAGQSAENFGSGRSAPSNGRRSSINNALDTLGDEDEIELDFGGFAKPEKETYVSSERIDKGNDEDVKQVQEAHGRRSKDAGTTCKERFNYASFDCAATVLKTNQECKGSSAVLVENKDSYMLNQCSAKNKFMIVELCDDILIDTVVLANFEFFSSIFRTFRISVSDRYPVKANKWRELGTFEARNTRDVQAFLIENPLIWARFLKIDFITHYGNEFYCPVSLLRVHGKTMMEEFRHEGEMGRGEAEVEEDDVGERIDELEEVTEPEDATVVVPAPSNEDISQSPPVAGTESAVHPTDQDIVQVPLNQTTSCISTSSKTSHASSDYCTPETTLILDAILRANMCGCSANATPEPEHSIQTLVGTSSTSIVKSRDAKPTSTSADALANPSQGEPPKEDGPIGTSDSSETIKKAKPSDQAEMPSSSAGIPPKSGHLKPSDNAVQDQKSTSTQAAPSTPTTQESFFKSVHKRLQFLEQNSTLSLQYIEEQSRILRDAFREVEKRQITKTSTFLDTLNQTVFSELLDLRQQYDQIWQSTVIELENQREQHRNEMILFTSRLTMLADEVVFQKRMVIVQSCLVLFCIGLTLFSRNSSYLELPIIQNMLSRSQTKFGFRLYDSAPSSPDSTGSRSPLWRRRRSEYSILKGHRSRLSEDSRDGTQTPEVTYDLPTPTSETEAANSVDAVTEGSPSDNSCRTDSLDVDMDPREVQTCPPTPRGGSQVTRKNSVGWLDETTHPTADHDETETTPTTSLPRASSRLRCSEILDYRDSDDEVESKNGAREAD